MSQSKNNMDIQPSPLHQNERDELEYLRHALKCSNLGTWCFDFVNKVYTLDERQKELLGTDKQAIDNDEFRSMIHLQDVGMLLKKIKTHMSHLKPMEVEYRIHRFDTGECRWLSVTMTNILDDDGAIANVIGTSHDITERKKTTLNLAHSEQISRRYAKNLKIANTLAQLTVEKNDKLNCLLQEFMESMPDGLSVFDDSLNIMHCNQNTIHLSGLDKSLWAVGGDVRKLFDVALKYDVYPGYSSTDDIVNDLTSNILHHGKFNLERVQLDGKIISERYRKLKSGGAVCIYTDITDYKNREKKLEDLSAKLKEQSLVAQAASKTKSEFLANMSHEIRTPMNGVLGMAEILKRTELNDKQRSFVDTLHSSGFALLSIINDILDFSKIEAGKLELDPAPFSINDAIDDVATLIGLSATQKNTELFAHCHSSIPETLIGDVSRIRQVLINLVGNAVKFTHEGSVLIEASGAKKENNFELTLEIIDTGIGIPKDKIDSIFEQFTQAESSTTRKYGGTGLGLTIARHIVEAMGGDIYARSKVGEGSVFGFKLCLPITNAGMQTSSTIDMVDGSYAPITSPALIMDNEPVLIFCDHKISEKIIFEALTHWQANVIIATEYDHIIETLLTYEKSQTPIKTIILDYKSQHLNVIKTIKENPLLSKIKIAVIKSADFNIKGNNFKEYENISILIKPLKRNDLKDFLTTSHLESKVDDLKKTIEATKDFDGEPHSQNKHAHTKFSILIAEDNDVNRMVIEHMIDGELYDLTFAENGVIAYNLIKERQFDLIFMDISMPEMDGMECTKVIRSYEAQNNLPKTPILALTAHAMSGDSSRFFDVGMDDYLSKPIKKLSIDKALEKWLPTENDKKISG